MKPRAMTLTLLTALLGGAPACAMSVHGLSGAGQTIAVIDSGVAYDHLSLAGAYRGGWDFTENDNDPYDDGSTGHGTAVTGVAVANHATHSGLAPGADLLSLRVINDAGTVYFSWVEDALNWVIENRTAYESPITTVNLSLGAPWNSDEPPDWAMLEDEFATLNEAGVFISVSAGNDFSEYGQPGLDYPASSPHVVAAMSVKASGSLSGFSQRHPTAIAAVGEGVHTTRPDHLGDNDGVGDDWARYSGTSFAAPYVAGASMLIREAMEGLGYENVNQDVIYDHMRATADSFFDSATELTYRRLDLDTALGSLLGAYSPGDLNFDGHVDSIDFTVWRDGLPSGKYDAADYQAIRDNYGASPPAGGPAALLSANAAQAGQFLDTPRMLLGPADAAATTPEPASAAGCAMLLALLAARGRRARR